MKDSVKLPATREESRKEVLEKIGIDIDGASATISLAKYCLKMHRFIQQLNSIIAFIQMTLFVRNDG